MNTLQARYTRILYEQDNKFVSPIINHASGNAKFAVIQVVPADAQPPEEIAEDYQPGKTLITTFPAYGIAMHFASKCKEFAQLEEAEFIVKGFCDALPEVDREQNLYGKHRQ